MPAPCSSLFLAYRPKDGTHESTDADDSGDVQLDAGRRKWFPHVPTMYRWVVAFFGWQVQKRRASRESSGLWPGTWDRVGFQWFVDKVLSLLPALISWGHHGQHAGCTENSCFSLFLIKAGLVLQVYPSSTVMILYCYVLSQNISKQIPFWQHDFQSLLSASDESSAIWCMQAVRVLYICHFVWCLQGRIQSLTAKCSWLLLGEDGLFWLEKHVQQKKPVKPQMFLGKLDAVI